MSLNGALVTYLNAYFRATPVATGSSTPNDSIERRNYFLSNIQRFPLPIWCTASLSVVGGVTDMYLDICQQFFSQCAPSRFASLCQAQQRVDNSLGGEKVAGVNISQRASRSAAPARPVRTEILVTTEKVAKVNPADFTTHSKQANLHSTAAHSSVQCDVTKRCAQVKIVIDKRERVCSSHSMFLALFAEHQIEVISSTLPCGDFAFVSATDESEDSIYYHPLIVERKTFGDLCGSVLSSRLQEQKQLMLRSPFSFLFLLLEFTQTEWSKATDEERKRARSSITTASLIDGLNVVVTSSPCETVLFLQQLAKKLSTTPSPPIDISCKSSVKRVDVLLSGIREELHRNFVACRMLSHCHGLSAIVCQELLSCIEQHHRDRKGGPLSSLCGLADVLSASADTSSVSGCLERLAAIRREMVGTKLKSKPQKRAVALLTHFFLAEEYT